MNHIPVAMEIKGSIKHTWFFLANNEKKLRAESLSVENLLIQYMKRSSN